MSNVLLFRRPLVIKRRNYAYTDILDRNGNPVCRLVSMPKGYRVTNPSIHCRHLDGTHFQTSEKFEREYLRSRSKETSE